MTRRQRIIIGVLLAAAVGIGLVTLLGNGPGLSMRSTVAPAIAIMVAVMIFIGAIAVHGHRKKQRGAPTKVETEAERLGFTYRKSADSGFHHDFGPLPGIPRGGSIKHVLTGSLDGRPITVFQHQYVINTGQAVIPVHHTAYVTVAPQWPSVTISGRKSLSRLLYRFGSRRGLQLEDPVFNASMKIKTDDEDFTLTLIHPDMQQFLTEKRTAVWRIHAGCCALIYSGSFRIDRMEASLDRLRRFWALVPPELSAW